MWYMNEERQLLQKTMQEFVQNEVKPFVPKMEQDETYPREIIRKLGQMGVLGLVTDEKHGGVGEDWISLAIVIEEISKESNTMGLLTALASEFAPGLIANICTPEQVEKYIRPAFKGEVLWSGYCTEACGVTNFGEFETKAVLKGDEWVINGSKILGTNTGVSDYMHIVCKTGDWNPKTMTGMSLIMVPTNTPGVKYGHIENKLGWKGTHTGSLYLDDVHVPKENLIGPFNGILPLINARQPGGLSLYGAMALGSAESVWNRTRTFLSERIQQGQSLWDKYQHIRCEMAKMWMDIENYRGAVYSVMASRNQGEDVGNRAIALKVAGPKLLESVASQCMLLHGGTGYVVESDIERFYRDAPFGSVGCGSTMSLTDGLSYSI